MHREVIVAQALEQAKGGRYIRRRLLIDNG